MCRHVRHADDVESVPFRLYQTTDIYTLSLHDALPILRWGLHDFRSRFGRDPEGMWLPEAAVDIESLEVRSEEHTSELQSRGHLVCRLLLEKNTSTYSHILLSWHMISEDLSSTLSPRNY